MTMYKRLKDKKTKGYYLQILNETIELVQTLSSNENNGLYKNLYLQLVDVKKNVVEEQKYSGWEQVNSRYTIGAIATKNFENDDELRYRLCDIFGGAMDYSSMPEE